MLQLHWIDWGADFYGYRLFIIWYVASFPRKSHSHGVAWYCYLNEGLLLTLNHRCT